LLEVRERERQQDAGRGDHDVRLLVRHQAELHMMLLRGSQHVVNRAVVFCRHGGLPDSGMAVDP